VTAVQPPLVPVQMITTTLWCRSLHRPLLLFTFSFILSETKNYDKNILSASIPAANGACNAIACRGVAREGGGGQGPGPFNETFLQIDQSSHKNY
jgi:hypothetical protein